jgi:sarcosine oxidase
MPGQHHGSSSFLQDTIDAARQFRIPHETLETAEVRQRFPQLRLKGDEAGYFEPDAGFLRPEACIETHLELARKAGARVILNETVNGIAPSPDGTVEVQSNSTRYSAAHVIFTAGAWISKLLGERYSHLFRIYRQTLSWFALAAHADRYTPERFPVFIWITGNRPKDMMYGFPAVSGPDSGVKIATEQYETTVDPDAVPRDIADAEIANLYGEYIAPRFPDISNRCLRATTCLYTVTPDAKFIVDTFDGIENAWLASACSGHGFKHSAALGEALARQALGEKPLVDLSMFSLRRFHTAR